MPILYSGWVIVLNLSKIVRDHYFNDLPNFVSLVVYTNTLGKHYLVCEKPFCNDIEQTITQCS